MHLFVVLCTTITRIKPTLKYITCLKWDRNIIELQSIINQLNLDMSTMKKGYILVSSYHSIIIKLRSKKSSD